MQLDFEVFDSCDVHKYPAFNPRAEVPILQDGDTTVRNSATIVDYLHKRFPGAPSLLPSDPKGFAKAKEWELIADTMVDPIVTNCGIFKFADLPEPPAGMQQAAAGDLDQIYDKLEATLVHSEYVAGSLSIADLALYPHLLAAQRLGLSLSADRHPSVARWLQAIMALPIGRADMTEVLKWWANQASQDVDTDRINWGTYRLEWFLAHGFHEWFQSEIERDAVLWSVGPDNNAQNSPHHPEEAAS